MRATGFDGPVEVEVLNPTVWSQPVRTVVADVRARTIALLGDDQTVGAAGGGSVGGDMRGLRVVVAPDSFKGTMSASVVAAALAEGVETAGAIAVVCPLADGGEGTTEVLRSSVGGQLVELEATGPLGSAVPASFLLADDGRTAVVETAAASGLHLVPVTERDAEAATSAGTGELLAAAAAAGAAHIMLGVGGSACTDGGVGALAAIDAAGGLRGARLSVLCDVQTPFEDAARVFGPQKGADPAAVDRLSRRLGQVASRLPRDPRGRPGTGAAGGLSGALWAALDAELVTGIDTVLDMVGFGGLVEAADAVVTGEGCLDSQTAQGKVVAGVSRRAAKAGVPVWAVVGRSEVARSAMAAMGLVDVVEAGDPVALSRAAHHLTLALAHGRTAIRIDTSQRG